jgi:hypothetical protein
MNIYMYIYIRVCVFDTPNVENGPRIVVTVTMQWVAREGGNKRERHTGRGRLRTVGGEEVAVSATTGRRCTTVSSPDNNTISFVSIQSVVYSQS